jgi:hypothetical protein
VDFRSAKSNITLTKTKNLRLQATKRNHIAAQIGISIGAQAGRQKFHPFARVGTFLVMNGGVSKAWIPRSRVKLSKALQETLLDAVAGNRTGVLADFSGDKEEDLLTHH